MRSVATCVASSVVCVMGTPVYTLCRNGWTVSSDLGMDWCGPREPCTRWEYRSITWRDTSGLTREIMCPTPLEQWTRLVFGPGATNRLTSQQKCRVAAIRAIATITVVTCSTLLSSMHLFHSAGIDNSHAWNFSNRKGGVERIKITTERWTWKVRNKTHVYIFPFK